MIYVFTNTLKIIMNCIIWNSYYKNIPFSYILRPYFILETVLCFIMLRTIDFYCKFCFAAIKIHYIVVYDFLPENLKG